MAVATPEDVLRFWFDETPAELHFVRDAALDAAIAARFGVLHARLAAGVPDDWRATPRALLAAVIVLDPFSRNLFRDDPCAFACDPTARALVALAEARGDATALSVAERNFLFMPLMHSESLEDQDRSVAAFTGIGDANVAAYARRRSAIIARFGRFPARNDALGRVSTPAEIDFLRES